MHRRDFLGLVGGTAAAAAGAALFHPERLQADELAAVPGPASQIARDESFWFQVQRAFTVDRSLVNFNNGGVSPAPRVVQQAMQRYLEYSNTIPPYAMWQVLEPQIEPVRERLANQFGADPEEIAITRNASEGLEICQLGFDLSAGDEIVTSSQDYFRMLNTFAQRERRDGIVLKTIRLPIPAEDPAEVVARFEAAITARTRLILMCHVINLTGQILPVAEVNAMARRHGVPVLVDGAHGFAHLPFSQSDLDCDYYATSLHKWLFAPIGTGMLYVRRDRIPSLWPLMAADEKQDDDIRKFEEIGTHPAANHLAIAEALTFHEGIGAERKLARLVYLRDRWVEPLVAHDRVRLHTSLRPGFSGGIATIEVEGIDSKQLGRHLWKEHRIFVAPIEHPDVRGLRISPSVYSTLEEVDRFVEAMDQVIRHGLPT